MVSPRHYSICGEDNQMFFHASRYFHLNIWFHKMLCNTLSWYIFIIMLWALHYKVNNDLFTLIKKYVWFYSSIACCNLLVKGPLFHPANWNIYQNLIINKPHKQKIFSARRDLIWDEDNQMLFHASRYFNLNSWFQTMLCNTFSWHILY